MRLRAIDLFCGASGGWSLGLERAGIRTVAACELDPWRRAVFSKNHPGCRMYADVRELSADRLMADLGYLPDIVVGSPPCQEISAANSKGTGITDDHLFWEWARLVFEIRPLWCAAENSPRARTTGIDGILAALDQANYAAWPLVVGARHAGANHRRERMWLIAADGERLGVWEQPWRVERTGRSIAAVARVPDADASCIRGDGGWPWGHGSNGHGEQCASPDARRDADRCLWMGAGADGDITRDPASLRCGEGWAATIEQRHGADCGFDCDAGNANGAGHALGSCEPGYDGAELPAPLRAIGLAWPNWNGGLAGLSASCAAAGFGAVDDGSIPILAPSLRNRAIAALGDAVLPQITEAIARAALAATARQPEAEAA